MPHAPLFLFLCTYGTALDVPRIPRDPYSTYRTRTVVVVDRSRALYDCGTSTILVRFWRFGFGLGCCGSVGPFRHGTVGVAQYTGNYVRIFE